MKEEPSQGQMDQGLPKTAWEGHNIEVGGIPSSETLEELNFSSMPRNPFHDTIIDESEVKMSSNLENRMEDPASSRVTVNSPDKPESSDPRQESSHVAQKKIKCPIVSYDPRRACKPEQETQIGNPEAIEMLKREGQLGVFYDRARTTRIPTPLDINVGNIRGAAQRVLSRVLKDKAVGMKELDVPYIDTLITQHATHLANGVSIMTYCKLRFVNYHDERISGRYRAMPKVPVPFEVPHPYALAISELGKLKLSGMVNQVFVTPTVPEDFAPGFACPPDAPWSITEYAKAVEFAKKLGLGFAAVDLTVKMGSSWWLYRYTETAPLTNVRLDCPFPEENFTVEGAVLATLFMNDQTGGFNNPVVNPTLLGELNYGSMLRNPFHDISIETFYAVIVNTPELEENRAVEE